MDSQDRGFSQFLHKAASYIPDSSAPATATSTHSEGHGRKPSSEGHGKKPPSSSEALSSAKYLLDTAVSKLHKAEAESGGDHPIDKAKIAAAAGDVLAAAKHYAKLDEGKNGTYLQKAEDYLRKYGEGNGTSSGNSGVHNSAPHTASHNSAPHVASYESAPHASSHSGSEDEENKAMDSQEGGFSQFLHKAASYVPDSSDSDRANSEGHGRKLSSEGHGEKAPSEGHGKKSPSSSEALSSAKYLLDTAVSKLHKAESESGGDRPIDKAKIAAAAGDVLAAAKHYGKLDESKNGTYLQKAEDYLNKYGEENRTSSENSGVHTSAPHDASHESAPHAASHESAPHASSKSGSEDEENKYGEYFKQAESLFNKF